MSFVLVEKAHDIISKHSMTSKALVIGYATGRTSPASRIPQLSKLGGQRGDQASPLLVAWSLDASQSYIFLTKYIHIVYVHMYIYINILITYMHMYILCLCVCQKIVHSVSRFLAVPSRYFTLRKSSKELLHAADESNLNMIYSTWRIDLKPNFHMASLDMVVIQSHVVWGSYMHKCIVACLHMYMYIFTYIYIYIYI